MCASANSCHSGEGRNPQRIAPRPWTPACAGVTDRASSPLRHSGESRKPKRHAHGLLDFAPRPWTPACAGVTDRASSPPSSFRRKPESKAACARAPRFRAAALDPGLLPGDDALPREDPILPDLPRLVRWLLLPLGLTRAAIALWRPTEVVGDPQRRAADGEVAATVLQMCAVARQERLNQLTVDTPLSSTVLIWSQLSTVPR
jgi:hypothetical protein